MPRGYRLLLLALPRAFRARHGAGMAEVFAAARAEARRRGRGACVQLWAHEAADLLMTGARLRLHRHVCVENDIMEQPMSAGSGLMDDVVFATRSVVRHAAFFTFAALTLGFGVGATTAMYSALKSVVLEPPAYEGGERAVRLWRQLGSGLRVPASPEQIDLVTAETSVFDAAATYSGASVTVTGLGEPVRLEALLASAELAPFMSMQPLHGRLFQEEDLAGEGADVVLISHALWRSAFGGRPGIAGETLHVDGRAHTIIGVLPSSAVRPDGMPQPVDLWLPLTAAAQGRSLIARLAPGVTPEAAERRLNALLGSGDAPVLIVTPATSMRSSTLREPLRILMVAVALLLLIACVNVSNLLLHRNTARARDTVVRTALGATRARLIRQSLVESLLLALCGGAIGVAVAWAGTVSAAALRPPQLAAIQAVRMDRGVLLFSLLVSLGAWLLFSLLPAVRGTRGDAAGALSSAARTGAGGSARLRWMLVGIEIALSFMLLVGATTLIANVRESAGRDPGYEPAAFLALDVMLPSWKYRSEPDRRAVFERLRDRIERMPGVDAVALAAGVPPQWGITFGTVQAEGQPADAESSIFHGGAIDAAYLRVIGQPLVAGRAFLPEELRSGAGVAILGEAAARRIFAGGTAVGRRFRLSGDDFEVVGVVRDISIVGLTDTSERPIAYWPMANVWDRMQVIVRTERRDGALLNELATTVRSMERDALLTVTTGTKLLGASIARERFTATLLTAFATLALVLSAIGIYGVLSQIVTGRTQEIGLRVALGADQAEIRRLILGTGARVVALGLTAGALMVAAGLRVLRSGVFGIEHRGIGIYLIAALVLGATSLLAMWRPAARAARVDPVRAMSGS